MPKKFLTERKSNEMVLEERRNLTNSIRKRKNRLIGHIIRHNNFIRTHLRKEGVLGRRPRRRPIRSIEDVLYVHSTATTTA